ncbi:MAG TPA: alpha/beta hydrolase [Blastocatellia bacterium]|nr:alpha/beta hydrolase [Blastocatellia bacterium]
MSTDRLFKRSLICVFAVSALMLLLESRAFGQSPQLTETTFVESNGAKLFIEMRGPANKTPILLYLHGGPGNALGIVAFRAYVGPELESKYLVVYLHQRGVIGSPAVRDSSQTITNHVSDVRHIVEYLRKRFFWTAHIFAGSFLGWDACSTVHP